MKLVNRPSIKDTILTDYKKDIASSTIQYMFSEKVDRNDITAEGNKMVYRTHLGDIKMCIDKIMTFYEDKKKEILPKFKDSLSKKALNMKYVVIKNKVKGNNASSRYSLKELEELAGPAIIKDMTNEINKTDYDHMPVNIVATIEEGSNNIVVVPAFSEQPGSRDVFDPKVIGHDIGFGNILEYEMYGRPFEKGF